MRGKRIIPVFLYILVISGVTLCACSTQKNTESSSKIETTTTAQPATEQITTAEITVKEQTTETSNIKEQETAAPVTENIQNDSWKQIYLDYINNLSNSDYYEYALVYVDEDDIPELYMHGKQRPMSSELCWAYNDEVYSQWLMIDGFEYIEKENLFFSTGVQSGVQGDFVYKINGIEATQIHQGTASRLIQGQERFIWNGEDVSEDEYNSLRAEVFESSKVKTITSFMTLDELISNME